MSRSSQPDHPAPARSRIETGEAWFAIAAAPIAWSVQSAAASAFASEGCFTNFGAARRVGGVVPSLPLIVTAAMLIIASGAIWLSIVLVQRTRDETGKSREHLYETGRGRTHFMARWGLFISFGFGLAILINLVLIAVVPTCG